MWSNVFAGFGSALALSIWQMIWHFGFAAGLVILGMLWTYFSPIAKSAGVFFSAAVIVFIIGMAIGVADEKRHWLTYEQGVVEQENAARAAAEKSVAAPPARGLFGVLPHARDRHDRDGVSKSR